MKVRISYTVQVSDEYRRAIRRFYGEVGMATRDEVKKWFVQHGETANDDLMWTYGDEDGES